MLCDTTSIALVGIVAARPQLEDVVAQALAGQHVERRERLVHQQHVGLDDERARDADALAHAAGELARQRALEAGQADQLDGLLGARARARRGAMPRASRPISTFCCTVSQGNSANDWNTMLTPRAGPYSGWPR